jgi:gluconokinase
MMRSCRVIIALDIGSSSARCSAYYLQDNSSDNESIVASVETVPECSASLPISSVQSLTGKIFRLQELLDAIDAIVEETIQKIRENVESFEIVGVGFSSFVMNMVGVDAQGKVVGPEASISYACNTPEIAREVCELKR